MRRLNLEGDDHETECSAGRAAQPGARFPGAAYAGVVAQISLSNQRMQVYVNGEPTYTWKVSTARRGYRTPTGTYKPTALVALPPLVDL